MLEDENEKDVGGKPLAKKKTLMDKKLGLLSKCTEGITANANTEALLPIESATTKITVFSLCAAILTDFSKAFDCICHNLLIAKLNAYGVDRNALKLVYDYLSDRSQKSDFANYADDTTPYECGPTLNEVMNNLEITTEKMLEWFSFNNLKANTSTCHLSLSPYQPLPVNIKGSIIESSNCEKLLGIYIDSNFSFEYHINRICRKTSQKLHALSRISKFISENKKRMLFKYFIISQFNYCPIVWMCHGRGLNSKINNIHERGLRVVYHDKISSFKTLLKRDKSASIHMKNLQYLATELFKVKYSLSPEIMKKIFVFQEIETYNLRSGNHLARKNIRTTQFGIESVSILGAKLWKMLPGEIKNSSSLTVFKNKIRNWIPEKCPCKLCQTYIKNFGYI